MDIQHLKYFLTLADTLNYTTAARQCYISRQGMRQAIQAIEKEYGLTLVINEHNHLSLTPAGVLLRTHAETLLTAYEQLDVSMHRYAAQNETIRIGISRSIIPFYAPDLVEHLESYAGQFPNNICQIEILSADKIVQRLQDDTLDAGLLIEAGDGKSLPDIPWQRSVLRQHTMTMLMASSHPLAKKSSLTLDDLSGQTILLMSDPEFCFSPLQQALQDRQIPVSFRVVPDYYEVGYQILNSDVLAIDREEAAGPVPSRLDRNLSLESGRFSLYCSLLIPEQHIAKLSPLQQNMLQYVSRTQKSRKKS